MSLTVSFNQSQENEDVEAALMNSLKSSSVHTELYNQDGQMNLRFLEGL